MAVQDLKNNQSQQPTNPTRQPVLYIPHGGGPCFFMEWNPPETWNGMEAYLADIKNHLPAKPSAILIISGHWLTPDFRVSAGENPELHYDYGGFPAHTYELTYPAAGDPKLAQQVQTLISEAGLQSSLDAKQAFDHGVFIPLKVMFPEADIPVVQLSLRQDLDPAAHIQAGKALTPLRDQGVLIIGSGMSFHNMRGYGDKRYTPVSIAFDDWLTDTLAADPAKRNLKLSHWQQAPYAEHCHPPRQEEHLLPLMVAAGAAADDRGKKVYSEIVTETRLSGFQFG